MLRRRNNVRGRVVRQTPLIYGNLQKPPRDYSVLVTIFKRALWFGSLGAIAWLLFWSPVFTVKNVEVQGSLLSKPDAIDALVPRGGSIWFIQESRIKQAILASEPVVNVSILRGIPDSIRVVVEERKPVMLWQSGDGVSLIDEGGEVLFTYKLPEFPTAETEPGTTLNQLPRVTDTKNVPVQVGGSIATQQFTGFVTQLQTELGVYLPDMVVARLEVQETTYDLQVVTVEGLRVQMNTLGDPAVQVRNLKRLLTQESIPPTAQVDMRIDRWAYVRP